MTESSPGLISVSTGDSAEGQNPVDLFTSSGWTSLSGTDEVEFDIKLFDNDNRPVVYEVNFVVSNPQDVSNIKVTLVNVDGNTVGTKNVS